MKDGLMEIDKDLMESIIRELINVSKYHGDGGFYVLDEPALTRNSFIIYMERFG